MLKKLSITLIICAIVSIVIIVAIGGNSQNETINGYLQSLKQNNIADDFKSSLTLARNYQEVTSEEASRNQVSTATIEGFNIKYNKITTEIGSEDLSYSTNNNNFIYPGAMVSINALESDTTLSPIVGLKRSPITITPTLQGTTGIQVDKKIINDITPQSIKQALIDVPQNSIFSDSQFPFILSSQLIEIKSKSDLSIALGLPSKISPNYSLLSDFNFYEKSNQNYAIMLIKQVFYKVSVDYPIDEGANGFFDESVKLSDIKKIIKYSDTPAYVSSVSYGRVMAITIKSDLDIATLESKIKLDTSNKNNDISADFSVAEDLDKTAKLKYYVLGNNVEDSSTISNKSYPFEIQNTLNSKFDINNNLVPISYRLSHLGDGSSAKVGSRFVSYSKDLTPKSVDSINFLDEDSNYIKTSAFVGSKNIELKATINPTDSILYPLSYKIKNSYYNSDTTSILKDSSGENVIATIVKEYVDNDKTFKYYLSIADNNSNIGRNFSIIASAQNKTTELDVEILKNPVEKVEWDEKMPTTIYPGENVNLFAQAYPKNASNTIINYEISNEITFARITNGVLKVDKNAPEDGEIELSAISDNVRSSSLTIIVKNRVVTDFFLTNNKNTNKVLPGDSLIITPRILPDIGIVRNVEYEIDNEENIEFNEVTRELKIKSSIEIGTVVTVTAQVEEQVARMQLQVVSSNNNVIINSDKGFKNLVPGQEINLSFDNIMIVQPSWSTNLDSAVLNLSNSNRNCKIKIPESTKTGKFQVTLTADGINSSTTFDVNAETREIELSSNSQNLLNLSPGDKVNFNLKRTPVVGGETTRYDIGEIRYSIYNKPSFVSFSETTGEVTVNSFDGKYDGGVFYVIAKLDGVESNRVSLSIKSNIYYIDSVEALSNISNDPSGSYELLRNLDLQNRPWTPIKNFSGKFDGKNYTISNIDIKISNTKYEVEENFGLFAVNNGSIKNIKLKNVSIFSADQQEGEIINVGGLVGSNTGFINFATIEGGLINISRNNSRVGGVVGYNKQDGDIKDCVSSIDISSSGDIGGIAAVNNSSRISNSVYKSSKIEYTLVNKNRCIGGIVGNNVLGAVIQSCSVNNIEVSIMSYSGLEWNKVAPFIGLIVGKLESSNMWSILCDNSVINSDCISSHTNNGNPVNAWYDQTQNIGKGYLQSYGNTSGTVSIK